MASEPNLIMEQDSLSYKTLKNSTYTFFNYSVPILFSVFITPVIVHRLGTTDFGVYVLVNTLIGFLGLLDIGLTAALIKFISEYIARNDYVRLQKLINSANSLYLIIGVLGLLAFVVLGTFFLPFFHISFNSVPHIAIVFILAGAMNFLSAVNSIYTIVPAALQRFDITSKSSLTQLFFLNIATLIAVLLGYKLKIILLLNFLSICGLTLYLHWQFKKLLPTIVFGFSFNKEEIKKVYKYGLLAAVSNISNGLLYQLDRLIIPIFLGPTQLTYYSLPGNVAQKSAGVTGSISGVLFPLTSGISATGELEKIKAIYLRTIRNITLLAASFSMAIAVLSYKILFFWLGLEFAQKGSKILVILAATYFLLSLFGVLTNFLMGLNRVKFLAIVSILMAGTNAVLLFIFLPVWGILGAAWAYLGAALLVPAIFFWSEKYFLRLENLLKFYAALYFRLVITSVIFLVVMNWLVLTLTKNLLSLIILGPFSVLLYLAIYKLLGFYEKEDWELLLNYWQKVKSRFRFIP